MWFLVGNVANAPTKIWLRAGKTYTIGRKDSDITLAGDKTVSREHAAISVAQTNQNELGDLSALPAVTLTDKKSKFGTLVNDAAVIGSIKVSDGVKIKFGAASSEFSLIHEAVVVCFSGLRASQRSQIHSLALKYDIKALKEWSPQCTHLIVATIKITMKVILALVSCRHIVTDEWIKSFETLTDTQFAYPDPVRYLPQVSEDLEEDISFLPNEGRKKIFDGYSVFVFSATDYIGLKDVIKTAGGEIINCTDNLPKDTTESLKRRFQAHKSPCLIRPDDISANHLSLIKSAASSLSLRLVSQDDVAKAVLHISSEYCDAAGVPDDSIARDRSDMLPSVHYSESQFETPGRRSSSRKLPAPVVLAPVEDRVMPPPSTPARAEPDADMFDNFLDDLIGGADDVAETGLSEVISQSQAGNNTVTSLAEQLGMSSRQQSFLSQRLSRAASSQRVGNHEVEVVEAPNPKLETQQYGALRDEDVEESQPRPAVADKRPVREDLAEPSNAGNRVAPTPVASRSGESFRSRAVEAAKAPAGEASSALATPRKRRLPFGSNDNVDEVDVPSPKRSRPSTPSASERRVVAQPKRQAGPSSVAPEPVIVEPKKEQTPEPKTPSTARRRRVIAAFNADPSVESKIEKAVRLRQDSAKKEKDWNARQGDAEGGIVVDDTEVVKLKGLIRVEWKDLVVPAEKRRVEPTVQASVSGPNFKRFRKSKIGDQIVPTQTRILELEPYNRDSAPVLGRDGEGWVLPDPPKKTPRRNRVGAHSKTAPKPKARATGKGRKKKNDSEEEEEEEDEEISDEEDVEMLLGNDDSDDDVDGRRVNLEDEDDNFGWAG